jgi:arylsulfatase A-like enzyme
VTGGFGKWHLTPDNVQGPAGPFSRWPQAWGFDHWRGFLSGAAGQYDPIITQDNSVLGVLEGADGGQYYFPDDLTDKAVEWLHGVRAQDAAKPWFMYYSTGCAHAPHQVARAWADKYQGRFDGGWDQLREQTFERQKRLGIIPADAIAADAELRRRHPDQRFAPLRSAEPERATQAQNDELTLTAGEEPHEVGQWTKDLAAARRVFADRLADRQSLTIPAEDPEYGDLGQAFPTWTGRGGDAILQPPKPEIRPSAQILQRAIDRDAGLEATD